MYNKNCQEKKLKVHFIGIGGIGVSALAQYYLAKGHKVSGSDLVSSEITDALKKKGAKIFIGKHGTINLPEGVDLVIYSPAIQLTNPELKEAHQRQIDGYRISINSYPQALGELTKQHFTIAISGTHGKSTTTAMVALILIKAGLDPTVIIGTKLKEFADSNFRAGKSNYLVIEADEHQASFLNYWPRIIVLTNIDADHLDYYKNLKNIRTAFNKFISHLPPNGMLISEKSVEKKVLLKLRKILKVPGEHIAYDASLALTAAHALKVPDKISFRALSEYRGAWRRFEIIRTKPFVLVSDYGHNPPKALATLKAAREKWPKKKIWCVYQPHQYQRTYYLFKDFVKVFKRAPIDKLIITDIFDVAGREEKSINEKVSSEKLVKAVKKDSVIYLPKEKITDYLGKNVRAGEVVIIMGAGDIYQIISKLDKEK